MKKTIVIGTFLLGTTLFAGQITVPEQVEKELYKTARTMSGSERNNYILWQKKAYNKLKQIGQTADIPANEYDHILNRLHQMYGSNYQKQLQVVDDEIADYKEVVRRINESVASGKPDPNTNEQAKKEIFSTINNTAGVPKEVLYIYKASAEELYPDNYVAQKKYMDSVITTYPKLINWIKQNKNVLN